MEDLTFLSFILFSFQVTVANLKIIELAPEYSIRLDESIKEKISISESILGEMNHLIEELIIHDGDDESDEELKELFENMDDLINNFFLTHPLLFLFIPFSRTFLIFIFQPFYYTFYSCLYILISKVFFLFSEWHFPTLFHLFFF